VKLDSLAQLEDVSGRDPASPMTPPVHPSARVDTSSDRPCDS
jgi:hypothetical protein